MPRNIDVRAVVKTLAQDAPVDSYRKQQVDTALLVGQVVSNLREMVQARHERQSNESRETKPRFDVVELERELAALEARLEMCRANLSQGEKNQAGKLRFIRLGEKRRAALTDALERLRSRS
jgi:hypothetical protein